MTQASLAPPFGLTGARRVVAIATAAFVLTSFFVVIGFPYDRVVSRVEQGVAAVTGQPLRIGRMAIGVGWFAPELRAWDVDATLGDGRRLHFDRIRVRPAWSLAWLRARPALVIALRSPSGEVDGTVTFGSEPAFRGGFRDVQLKEIPIEAFALGTTIDGRGRGEVDLAFTEAGPGGTAKVDVEQGSLTLPILPIGIPFETLTGSVALGGDVLAKIDVLELTGPLVSLSANGTIGQAPVAQAAPLALSAKLRVAEPSLRSLITSQGVALDANGEANLEIGGTLAAPEPRPARARGSAP